MAESSKLVAIRVIFGAPGENPQLLATRRPVTVQFRPYPADHPEIREWLGPRTRRASVDLLISDAVCLVSFHNPGWRKRRPGHPSTGMIYPRAIILSAKGNLSDPVRIDDRHLRVPLATDGSEREAEVEFVGWRGVLAVDNSRRAVRTEWDPDWATGPMTASSSIEGPLAFPTAENATLEAQADRPTETVFRQIMATVLMRNQLGPTSASNSRERRLENAFVAGFLQERIKIVDGMSRGQGINTARSMPKVIIRDLYLALTQHLEKGDCDHHLSEHVAAARNLAMSNSDFRTLAEDESGAFFTALAYEETDGTPSVRDVKPEKEENESGFDRILLGEIAALGVTLRNGFVGVEVKTALHDDSLEAEVKAIVVGDRSDKSAAAVAAAAQLDVDYQLLRALMRRKTTLSPNEQAEYRRCAEAVYRGYRQGGKIRTLRQLDNTVKTLRKQAEKPGADRVAIEQRISEIETDRFELRRADDDSLATALVVRSRNPQDNLKIPPLAEELFDRVIVVNQYGRVVNFWGRGLDEAGKRRMWTDVAAGRQRFVAAQTRDELTVRLRAGIPVARAVLTAAGLDPDASVALTASPGPASGDPDLDASLARLLTAIQE